MNKEYILRIIQSDNSETSLYTVIGYFKCNYEWTPSEPKAHFRRDMELLGWQSIYNFVEKEKKFPKQVEVRSRKGELEAHVE